MTSRVRLADVAARVGVSPKTVSNVVNGTGSVSAPMKEKIRAAIAELGYRPNVAARQLRSGRSGFILLAVPSISEPYFAELASAMVDAARLRDATVLIAQSRGSRTSELALIEGEGFPELGGIVLNPLALNAEDISARRSTIPLLLIGEHGESLATSSIPHLGPDNVAAAREATDYLLAQGRRRIAIVGLQSRLADTAEVRFRGYREALEAAGIDIDPRLLVDVGRYNRAEGSAAITRLLDRGVGFDGVLCFNDSLAFGAIHTLARRGRAVPDDVAVVGFDNVEEGRYIVPRLPSIDTGVAASSLLVVDALLSGQFAGGGHIESRFTLATESGTG